MRWYGRGPVEDKQRLCDDVREDWRDPARLRPEEREGSRSAAGYFSEIVTVFQKRSSMATSSRDAPFSICVMIMMPASFAP